jgi:DNA-binding SARP family transcriptional activator
MSGHGGGCHYSATEGEGHVEFRILGPTEAVSDEGLVMPLHRPPRALLSVLLLFAGSPCSRDLLVRALWGGGRPPVDPGAALRVSVSRLRRALGQADCVTTVAGGYQAEPPQGSVDLGQFRDLHSQSGAAAAAGDLRSAAAALERALALWRYPPLADMPDSPEIAAETSCLLELRRLTEYDLADLLLDLGDHERIVADMHGRVVADPRSERAWAQLMLALHRCGRRGEALSAYAKAAKALAADHGARPGDDLQAILRVVLEGGDMPPARRRHRRLAPAF